MATAPRGGLLDQWLTIRNQGNDMSGSYGDASGPESDWMKMVQSTGSGLWDEAQRYGYTGSMPVQSYGDSGDYQPGNPQQELFDWMKSSGFDYGINPTMNGGQFNAWIDPQGQEVAGTRREFEAPNDNAFWAMANLAGGLVGGPMLASGLGSNAAAGAVLGGMGGFGQDMDIKDALKGAAIGGIGGGLKDYFSGFQPMPETGLSPMEFNPDDLFQGLADPTSALQQLPEIGSLPGSMPSISPSGLGSIPQGQFPQIDPGSFTQGLPSLPEVPTMPWQPPPVDPYAQTVEVTGKPMPFEPMPPTGLEPLPAFDASSLGIADAGAALAPLGPMAAMPGAMPAAGAAAGGLLNGIKGAVDSVGGLGTILPIAGAIAGSQPSGGGTETRQSRMDPRMDEFVYGSGGFLPSARDWFNANKSGANDTMRAGWQQQLGLLQDPQIAQQLSGMRNQGLLQSQAPIAGNPFTSGQMQLPNGGGGLLGQMQIPRSPYGRSTG